MHTESQGCWNEDPRGRLGGRGSQRIGNTCVAQLSSPQTTSGHLQGSWGCEGSCHPPWNRSSPGTQEESVRHPAPPLHTGLPACQARAGPSPAHLSSFCRPQEGRSRAKLIVGLAYLRGGLGTQSHRLFNAALFAITKGWNCSHVHQQETR